MKTMMTMLVLTFATSVALAQESGMKKASEPVKLPEQTEQKPVDSTVKQGSASSIGVPEESSKTEKSVEKSGKKSKKSLKDKEEKQEVKQEAKRDSKPEVKPAASSPEQKSEQKTQ